MLPMPEHCTHVWLVDQRQVTDELLKTYPKVLSEDELQRLEQISHPAVKRAQLISRAAVRYCLSCYADDIAPSQWQLARSEKGKPHLQQPAPLPLAFNLSHSGHWLAIAVIARGEIGLDVQEYKETPAPLKLAQRYFHPKELEQLQACENEQRQELFYRIWTLKEAFLKARGTGIVTGLEKIRFHFNGEGAIEATMAAELNEKQQDWSFYHTQLEANYSLALAARGQGLLSKPTFYLTLPGESWAAVQCSVDLLK